MQGHHLCSGLFKHVYFKLSTSICEQIQLEVLRLRQRLHSKKHKQLNRTAYKISGGSMQDKSCSASVRKPYPLIKHCLNSPSPGSSIILSQKTVNRPHPLNLRPNQVFCKFLNLSFYSTSQCLVLKYLNILLLNQS